MSSVVISGDTSGAITLAAPAVAGTNTLTLPAKTGNVITSADTGTVTQGMIGTNVGGTGPALSVYRGTSNQSISAATYTKIQLNTEDFDTNNNFDSTTNYRFTPTVAGYYLITLNVLISGSGIGSIYSVLYKNGANFQESGHAIPSSASGIPTTSAIIYFNGSTDYVEGYVYAGSGTSLVVSSSSTMTRMTACLLRGA